MEIEKLKILRGPNQWANFPVLEAWVDLGRLEDFPSNTLPGFNERLTAWLPTMIEHRCSVGERGGFFQRLANGTWMGHILEHVCLELQTLAGSVVGFGRARETSRRGVYRVAVQYKEERFAVECLQVANRLLECAIAGNEFDVTAEVERLHGLLLEERLGPSTRSIVEAAKARGIPTTRLNKGSLVRLGQGSRQRRIIAAETDATPAIAEAIAQDKELTRGLLFESGIPVPEGRPVASAEEAWEVAVQIGVPVVVKPRFGNQGRGVSVNLFTREEVERAWIFAREEGTSVVVEQFINGGDYRLLIVGGVLVAAARRHPPEVIGDGVSSTVQLVALVNSDPQRAGDHTTALSPILLDDVALGVLADQGVNPESVIESGRIIMLRRNANLSTGGTSEDITQRVHPEVAARAIEAARVIGLDVAGVDIVVEDISRPLELQRGVIIEVNAGPGLRMHLEPTIGSPRDVGSAIIETLFEAGDEGRIPVAAVTGTNGKTTVVRLLSHMASSGGAIVGTTCTEGIWIGKRRIDSGDCSGPASARRVLANPSVTTAILETARGGILREGLGFDRCDVAVVTNIGTGDHLGMEEVDTVQRLAYVKSTIVSAVSSKGSAVLNASDPLVVEMVRWCKGSVVYFSTDPTCPVLVAHLAEGGLAATVREDFIVLCDGPRETRLASLDRVPLVHRGMVRFQVENVLAASAAAWCLGVPLELVRGALESFDAGTNGSPARFNIVDINGASIVVDYGHNASSLEEIISVLSVMPHERRTVIYSVAGDRRDEDLRTQGELLAGAFERIVIYEDAYIRGRKPGEITAILSEGVRRKETSARPIKIESGHGWNESASRVLDSVRPGDLVLLQADTVDGTMEWLAESYQGRLRETTLDEAIGVPAGVHNRMPAHGDPVEVRWGRLGRELVATRSFSSGETVLKSWGPKTLKRTRHSMQVDTDTHIVPDGAMTFVNHSCNPNCGVIIRAGVEEIEVRTIRSIQAGEEITFDYESFEREVEFIKGPCLCQALNCRGRIVGHKNLQGDSSVRAEEFVAEYLRTSPVNAPFKK
jgi:cyanophycin synthetase